MCILNVISYKVKRNLKHQNIGIPTSTKGIWSENHVFLEWIAKTNPGSIENLPVAGMSEAQAGVRNLQKHIERICRKMATKVVEKWEGRLGLSGLVWLMQHGSKQIFLAGKLLAVGCFGDVEML